MELWDFLEGLLFLVIRLFPYILITAVICFVFLRDKIKRFMEEQKIKKEAKITRRALRGQNGMVPPQAVQNVPRMPQDMQPPHQDNNKEQQENK